ncbi:peroxisomal membrane protein PEX14-like isoform X1 [Punica granatum]|uniref:Peroxisomal membrane protein PEX14 n=1 Tax=Punica granatum TaxID=22663 RepID=A0A6P8BWH4_PUNGR|nr:peroxisomal membrane protein PEX14-like isoform X1 [Punica granatum]
MSTQSDGGNRTPADELARKTSGDPQTSGTEDTNSKSPPSVFVNSEPVREEQVQNAVKFLSHPRVQGSPVIYRRSFLERKGLTKEEIDEAFRRVPDPPPSAQAPTATQEGQLQSSANVQQQGPVQALQPATAARAGVIASVVPANRYRFHWYHAILAVGLLAGSGAGTIIFVKKAVIPRLRSWIRAVVMGEENGIPKETHLKPTLAEETTAAAKAAAAAAADVAKASEELLNSKLQEKKLFGEIMNLLDVQLREMKSIGVAVKNLQGQANSYVRNPLSSRDLAAPTSFSKQPYANGKADLDYRTAGRSSIPQASTEPSAAPHPKSYMEIMAMVQRGERPPNVKDIDDSPPNPNQPISNSRVAPRIKPWEAGQTQKSSNQAFPYQLNPGSVDNNGFVSQLPAISSGLRGQPAKNLRISEMEHEDELKTMTHSSSSFEQPIKHPWVPPQPPPVAMVEAAEAIRRPKPSIPREQLSDEQKVFGPSDAMDESVKSADISESGGTADSNGGNQVQREEGNNF